MNQKEKEKRIEKIEDYFTKERDIMILEEAPKNQASKIKLYCYCCNNTWYSNLHDIKKGQECPVCNRNRKSKDKNMRIAHRMAIKKLIKYRTYAKIEQLRCKSCMQKAKENQNEN